MNKLNVAIIGAGMAGISAARALTGRGHEVTVFEKSRGWGGRCATKRWEGHIVDHGAQYFTIRDERFRNALQRTSIRRLTAPVFDESGLELPDNGRWYHPEGNNRLARDLSRGISVKTETTITQAGLLLRRCGGPFDHVISTAPVPQSARLFGVELTHDCVPCLTVLFCYRGEYAGNTRGRYAVSDRTGPVSWSACENHKEGRVAPGHTVIVAHMSEAFSREYLELPIEELPPLVRPRVESTWGLASNRFISALGHRWRFARSTRQFAPPPLPEGLHLAGDAMVSSRIEDAWLSGEAVARRLCKAGPA